MPLFFNTVQAFEHGETGTLVRETPSEIQLIRDGKEIARFDSTLNARVSMARDGTLVFFDAWHVCYRADVGAASPTAIRCGKLPGGYSYAIDPGGKRLLEWRGRGGGKAGALVSVNLKGRDATTIWKGDTRQMRQVDLVRRGPPGDVEKTDGFDYADVLIADDGKTWAVIRSDQLVIGRGGKRTAALKADGELWDGNNPRSYRLGALGTLYWIFDLPRERLLAASELGVTALGFDGSVQLVWRSTEKCVSAPCVHGDEILVAVQAESARCVVKRLTARTLKYRGDLDALACQGTADRFSVLSLRDGGIALVPNIGPIVVMPAPGARYASTSLVRVAGQSDVLVPPPTASWYDAAIGERGTKAALNTLSSGARRSLARYLLERLADPEKLEALRALDPDAFAPYADAVLGWDDARMEQLQNTTSSWWRLGRGASGAALAALVRRIAAEPAHRKLAAFLIESEHEASLGQLADLARKNAELASDCNDRLVEIPKRGPAIRRYSPKRQLVLARAAKHRPTPGLSALTPIERVLPAPAGWSCRKPLHLAFGVDLALLKDAPLARSPLEVQPFVHTSCDSCDEALEDYVMAGKGRTVTLVGTFRPASTRRPRKQCPGYGADGDELAELNREIPLSLVADDGRDRWSVFATLGGQPDWVQQPDVPRCPRCRAMMFFVGQMEADHASGHFGGTLYGFHCERCGVATQITQDT